MITDNKRKIKAVRGGRLDSNNKPRYVLMDIETGEVLDDAQGYGYKDARKAYAAYAYKNRDKSKDGEKRRKKKLVLKFCKDNPEMIEDIEDLYFHIMKRKVQGEKISFNKKVVSEYFNIHGIDNLEFSIEDFLKYWDIV